MFCLFLRQKNIVEILTYSLFVFTRESINKHNRNEQKLSVIAS